MGKKEVYSLRITLTLPLLPQDLSTKLNERFFRCFSLLKCCSKYSSKLSCCSLIFSFFFLFLQFFLFFFFCNSSIPLLLCLLLSSNLYSRLWHWIFSFTIISSHLLILWEIQSLRLHLKATCDQFLYLNFLVSDFSSFLFHVSLDAFGSFCKF